mmetsp:Transcript_9230/g.10437  ORF Transcript_9230/g.10437 Transcript_9230/m.10437 type:complete len:316 (-) Transcript_9230:77-1024(-)|eukprot:CAMPEP_0205823724 /NCGR_PEP_ID=MMETSP0206-20130828/17750_1 /ASSEMBLY_ACC=CAM_ASM_000279 /TAXON_ID=36767 /ORGANISM="Euplotes focardii, Strain TN1" /LENGTH=315 /DNA_ID=CAMNT_0053121151 /DNA_START=31 /DNA_END=978 /DNA_ORIENTATION=-
MGLRDDKENAANPSDDLSRGMASLQLDVPSIPTLNFRELDAMLVELASGLLQKEGSVPVGKMGSLLHRAAGNHNLPAIIKEQYGGLKKFLEAHQRLFVVGSDHPFNPHVCLRAQLGPNGELPRANNRKARSRGTRKHGRTGRRSRRTRVAGPGHGPSLRAQYGGAQHGAWANPQQLRFQPAKNEPEAKGRSRFWSQPDPPRMIVDPPYRPFVSGFGPDMLSDYSFSASSSPNAATPGSVSPVSEEASHVRGRSASFGPMSTRPRLSPDGGASPLFISAAVDFDPWKPLANSGGWPGDKGGWPEKRAPGGWPDVGG